jgi:hypothetical protein
VRRALNRPKTVVSDPGRCWLDNRPQAARWAAWRAAVLMVAAERQALRSAPARSESWRAGKLEREVAVGESSIKC